MKIGLILPQWTDPATGVAPTPGEMMEFARSAEAMGIDSVWLTDHLYHEPYLDFLAHGYELPEEQRGVRSGYWECWTMLAAIASETGRVELGTLVTNTAFRNPALLANMAETVDALSDGRVTLGLGAGDFHSEHVFHGYPWERRISRFEEALQIIAPMLRGDRVSFEGDFYRTHEAGLLPRGPRQDGPPILIGMMQGGPRMRRLAVQYADGWSSWLAFEDSHSGNFAGRLERMTTTCESYGRDPDTLQSAVTIGLKAPAFENFVPGSNPVTGSPGEVAEELGKFADLGVDHLTVFLQPYGEAGLAWLEDVLAQFRGRSTRELLV